MAAVARLPRAVPDLQATHSFEIEVVLTGTYLRGYPERGQTYDSGGEPGEPDAVEDIDIDDIGMLERVKGSWVRKSILAGIDRRNPAYAQIVQNILGMIGEEAEQALLLEVSE